MRTVRFRIPINSKQWLSVTIWPTNEQFLAGTQHYYQGRRDNPARVAAYATLRGRKILSGEWGRLYFSKDQLGAGTVAHEIQHFMFDWVLCRLKKIGWRYDEPLAELCDKVTADFWRKYYRRLKN